MAWLTYECTRDYRTFDCLCSNLPGLKQIHHYLVKPTVAMLASTSQRYLGGPATLGVQTQTPSPLVAPACAVAAAAVMSVVPAHLLRSVAGGYDNESIAMSAMVLTFA